MGILFSTWGIVSIVIAAILFAAYYFKCAREISAVNTAIDSTLKNLESAQEFHDIDEADAVFAGNERLASVWKNFRGTLTQTRDGIFSSTDAAEFFSPQNFTRDMNMTFWQSYGGIFTGLGILGTFGGLIYGLSGVDMTSGDIEVLKTGIANLLSGVEKAFVTSLVGIFCAIVYSVFHHKLLKDFHANVQTLATALDKKFPCKTAETWLADNFQETRDQTTILQDAEGWLSDNLQETRRQLQETQKQTTTLQNSEAWLANNLQETKKQTATLLDAESWLAQSYPELQNQTVSLQNIGETVTEAIHKGLDEKFIMLDKKLDDVTQKICEAVDKLGTGGTDTLDKIFTKGVGAQMDRFAAALDRFSDTIDKKLQDSEKISKLMNDNLLKTLEELRELLIANAKANNKQTTETNQKFLASLGDLLQMLNAVAEKFKTQQETSAGNFESLVRKLLADLKDFAEQQKKILGSAAIANTTQINAAIKTFREIVDVHNQTTQDVFVRIQNLLAATEKFLSRVNDAGNSLTQAATPLKQSSELLKTQLVTTTRAAENFRNEITAQMKNLTNENQITRENLSALTGQLATFVKNFNGIADELERSTKIISDSLENYNGKINDGLSNVLTKFDKSMKDAVGHLQSLTEGLTDAVDDLKQLRNRR